MAIVYLNGDKLWVEGTKAYSIKEVRDRHESATREKQELEAGIKGINEQLDLLNADKVAKEAALIRVNQELGDVSAVLSRINLADQYDTRAAIQAAQAQAQAANTVVTQDIIAEPAVANVVLGDANRAKTVKPSITKVGRKNRIIID